MYAAVSTYIALGGIWALLLGLFISLMVVKGNCLEGVLVSAAVLVFVVAWVRSFKVEMSNEGIHYRSPFFRHDRVKWASIASVSTGVRWKKPTRSPLHMMIKSHDVARPVTINIKVFGRNDLAALAAAIRRWSPHAAVDKTIERMSAGQMPSLHEARAPLKKKKPG